MPADAEGRPPDTVRLTDGLGLNRYPQQGHERSPLTMARALMLAMTSRRCDWGNGEALDSTPL